MIEFFYWLSRVSSRHLATCIRKLGYYPLTRYQRALGRNSFDRNFLVETWTTGPQCVFFVANAHTLPGLIAWTSRDIETAAAQSRTIRASTNRRDSTDKSTDAAGNQCQAETNYPTRNWNRHQRRIRRMTRSISSERSRSSMITEDRQGLTAMIARALDLLSYWWNYVSHVYHIREISLNVSHPLKLPHF